MKQASRGKNAYDMLTIGAATRDVFVKSTHFEKLRSSAAPDGWEACLPLGAKIPIDELMFETGGGATNAAVTFARFGFATACVARVGRDEGGEAVRLALNDDGVQTKFLQVDPKQRTAYSFILVAGSGNRAILVARGASSHIDTKAIPWKSVSSGWTYLTSVAGNKPLLKTLFAEAKASQRHIAWNPGNGEIEMGLKQLFPYLMQTGILIMNREEAAALADVSPNHLDKIFSKLGSLPRLALVVTDGKDGAYAYARGVSWYAPAVKGKVLNTTGAGDAFGSAFTASMMLDGDIVHALKVASLNAFGVVSHMGAKAGILKKFPGAQELMRVHVRELP
ncbi:MAG: carbohydrate kinase family protein [Patescibacteria group bacterium]